MTVGTTVEKQGRLNLQAIARLLLGGALAAAAFGQGTPLPYTKIQFFSNPGQPLAGGSVCTYLSGTSTPKATYSDYLLTQANPQCVILDSAGRASIWLDSAFLYRIILKDSTGVTIFTQDGIPGSGSGTSTGGGSLWTLNGNTIYNSVSNSRVCISSTACTTSLALLDVAGSSASGSNYLIRIDDSTNAPGVGLYGSGAAYGFYTASVNGLQLRSPDNSSQLSVAQGNVTVFNGAASGGSNFNIKNSATQGSINPLQIQSSAGANLAIIKPNGDAVFGAGTTSTGGAVTSESTLTNAIGTPNGGITGQLLIATDSLFLIAEPQPALSSTGQARIYLDSGSNIVNASINGGAYAPFGGGGGGSTAFSALTAGTNATAAMVVGTGASLTVAGSGTINATAINATTVPTSPAADMVLITTATGVGAWSGATLNTTGLANCTDTGGNHLNYNTSTHVFSCGTSGGTVGSVSFGTITGATNTTAAMIVGSGASLTFGVGGLIDASQINHASMPTSGSIWKSNGTLQPVAAVFSDVVGMFSGGAGCSGTNLLAADGTCQAGGGGGSILGLNNTWTGTNIFNANVTIGPSALLRNAAGYGFNGSAGTYTGLAYQLGLAGGYGLGLGGSSHAYLDALYIGTCCLSGIQVIDSSRNGAFATISAASLTTTGGINSGSTISAIGNLSANTGNGGSVTFGNSEWQPLNTNTVALGDASHVFGSSYFNGLQTTGSIIAGGTSFASGLFITSTLTAGSGTLSIGASTTILPPSGTALNGTFTCSGGFGSITFSQGLATGYTCN